LDNAATSQKPRAVLEALQRYYEEGNANVHRGVHYLSEHATAAYEGAREKARRFLNAREACEVIFVRGTTEGENLVASSFGRANLKPGDEVLVSAMEHHSNIVPWQLACEERGAMICSVTFAKTTFAPIPAKFEAGTPHIARAIGLGAAIDYLAGLDRDALATHEQDLLGYATDQLAALPGVRLIGTAAHKASVVSFVVEGVHAHD